MSIQKLTISALLATILILASCTKNNGVSGSEAGNPSIISADVLINMPTSVANSSSNQSRGTTDEAKELYGYILDQNSFVNELVNGDGLSVKNVILFWMNNIPWSEIIKIGTYSATDSARKITVSYDQTKEYPFSVIIEDTSATNSAKVVAKLNGIKETPKGYLYLFEKTPDDINSDSLVVRVDFNKTDTARFLDVKITRNIANVIDGDEAKTFDYSLMEQNGILHISSCSFHPYIKLDKSDTGGYSYDYTTVADTLKNLAIVNLGIPPADYNDTTLIFSDYGVEKVYGNLLVNYLKNSDSTSDTVQSLVVTSYTDSLNINQIFVKLLTDTTFKMEDPSKIQNMTIEDLSLFLELNKDIDTSGDFATMLWITKMSQPVYFNGDGYVANGEDNIPTDFVNLASIVQSRKIKIPKAVKYMTISE